MMEVAADKESIAQARELYDRFPFRGAFATGNREKHNQPLVEFLASIPPNAPVYDVGCGGGYWLEVARRQGIPKENLHGVDLAPANAARLREKGFDVTCGNVLDLPFENNVADFTIANGVIHHAPDPFRAFHELVRVTRPGGLIYLSVYNRWNPYFYIVHRATLPLRYLYWNWSRKVFNIAYLLSKVVFQPLSYLVSGSFLDDHTGKTLFMDQVMTPYAHLFSKSLLRRYARRCVCQVHQLGYIKYGMMLAAVLEVETQQ